MLLLCLLCLLRRFLGEMPLSIDAAVLVAHGGKLGLLREALLLAALSNATPAPIHQPFASMEAYRQNLQRYGAPQAHPSDARSVLLANLAAYEFW